MYTVLIVGWKEGRDVLPISFAKMVRKHLAMGSAFIQEDAR
jgi:hypothetical protein